MFSAKCHESRVVWRNSREILRSATSQCWSRNDSEKKKLHISTKQSEKKKRETKMNSEHARAQFSSSEMRNSKNIYTSFSLLLQLARGKTTRECGEKICRARLSVWCNWNVLHSRRVVRDHRTLLSSSAEPSSQTLCFFSYSLARRTFRRRRVHTTAPENTPYISRSRYLLLTHYRTTPSRSPPVCAVRKNNAGSCSSFACSALGQLESDNFGDVDDDVSERCARD